MICRLYTWLSILLSACLGDNDVSYHHGNMAVTKQEAVSSCGELPGKESDTYSLRNYMKENNISTAWLGIYKKELDQWTWTNNSTRSSQLPGGSAERSCAGISSVERVLRPMRCNYGGEHEGVICEHRDKECFNTRCFQHDNMTFTFKCDVANWYVARDHCLKTKGLIAIMDTQEKINKFSENKQRDSGLALCNFFWAGLRKEDWFIDKESSPARTLWMRREPSPNLNCAVTAINPEGESGWRAVSCTDYHIAICAKDRSPLKSFTNEAVLATEIPGDATAEMAADATVLDAKKTEESINSTAKGNFEVTTVPFVKTSVFIITIAVSALIPFVIITLVLLRRLRIHNRNRSHQRELTVDNSEVQERLIDKKRCSQITEQWKVENRINDNDQREPAVKDESSSQFIQRNIEIIKRTEIKFAFVAPWYDPPNKNLSYIRFSVNDTICKVRNPSKGYNLCEYLYDKVATVVRLITREENTLVTIEHFIVAGRMINTDTLDRLIDLMLTSNTDVAYLYVSIPPHEVYSTETEKKLHDLSKRCVLITPALKSKLAQSTITVGPKGRTSSYISIYGGLLDFFIDQQQFESDGSSGAFASALAIAVRLFCKHSENDTVHSTRIMRRILVDLCLPPQEYDPSKGFGTLRGTEDVFNSEFFMKMLHRHGCMRDEPTQPPEKETCMSETADSTLKETLELFRSKKILKVIGVICDVSTQKGDKTSGISNEVLCSLLNISSDYDMKDLIQFVYVWVESGKSCNSFTEAMRELIENKSDLIIHAAEVEGDDPDMYKCLNEVKKTCVVITGLDRKKVKIFPSADVIAVRHGHDIGAVGGRIDFCEPVGEDKGPAGVQTFPTGPWFTGTISAFIIMMAEVNNLSEDRLQRLRSTTTMRHMLVDMCSHPEEHLPGEGYGFLNPWPFIEKWEKLKTIIDKHTENNENHRFWIGKDI